jgi:hemerythrin superfamily protein
MQSDMNLLPVRGSTVQEIIENDHNVIKALLDSLTHASVRERRMEIVKQLQAALTIHNAMEENLVYPALDKVAGHMLESQKLYHETASADILLFQIDTMLKEGDDAKFGEKAEKLHDAVFAHIEAEEGKALPHLSKGAETSESRMLLESVREFRNSLSFRSSGAGEDIGTRSEIGEIGGRRTPSSAGD